MNYNCWHFLLKPQLSQRRSNATSLRSVRFSIHNLYTATPDFRLLFLFPPPYSLLPVNFRDFRQMWIKVRFPPPHRNQANYYQLR